MRSQSYEERAHIVRSRAKRIALVDLRQPCDQRDGERQEEDQDVPEESTDTLNEFNGSPHDIDR